RDGHVTGVQTCALPIFDLEFAIFVRDGEIGMIENPHPGLHPRMDAAFDGDLVLTGLHLDLVFAAGRDQLVGALLTDTAPIDVVRSEERRVGKEWRWWGR